MASEEEKRVSRLQQNPCLQMAPKCPPNCFVDLNHIARQSECMERLDILKSVLKQYCLPNVHA